MYKKCYKNKWPTLALRRESVWHWKYKQGEWDVGRLAEPSRRHCDNSHINKVELYWHEDLGTFWEAIPTLSFGQCQVSLGLRSSKNINRSIKDQNSVALLVMINVGLKSTWAAENHEHDAEYAVLFLITSISFFLRDSEAPGGGNVS